MVKLNLLDLPDEQDDTASFEAVEPVPAEEPTADFDFSFFQPDDDTSTVFSEPVEPPPPPPPPPLFEEPVFEEPVTFDETVTETPRENPFAVEDDFQSQYEDGVFEEDSGSSNWMLYSLIGLFLLSLAAGGWWWVNRDDSGSIARRPAPTTTTAPGAVTTPPATVDNGDDATTPPPGATDQGSDNGNTSNPGSSSGSSTPGSGNANTSTPPLTSNDPGANPTPSRNDLNNRRPVPTDLRGQFNQNTGDNQYHVNYANRFLDVNSAHADPSLLVVTPGRVYLSVLGDTRDDIARYRTEVKNSADLATLHLKTEHAEVVFVDNQAKFLADLSVKIASQNAQPGAAGQTSGGISQVRADINQMARSNGLSMTYFQQGDRLTSGRFARYNVYTKVAGAKGSVLQFLDQMVQDMPAAKVNKISLYPTDGSTIGNGRMEARVEFTFYDGSR